MAIYLLSKDSDDDVVNLAKEKVGHVIPDIIPISSLDVLEDATSRLTREKIYVLLMGRRIDQSHLGHFLERAGEYRGRVLFIVISDEISATDYKALLQTGLADWVSLRSSPQEIRDTIARDQTLETSGALIRSAETKPVAVSFVPSAGGVGNATLVVEVATYLKTRKEMRNRNICIVDLDFQSSHICDYLDIEPRLQIQDISANPERLDAQLLEIFISRHSSGVHVFAAPRSRFDSSALNISALDVFFDMVSARYDLILIDFPVTWFAWTDQVLLASRGIVVSGINSIPGLRQLSHRVAAVYGAAGGAGEVVVAVDRCERRLFGNIARRHHVESVLGQEKIFYIAEEPLALEAINTGIPMTTTKGARRFSKDIAPIAEFCSGLRSAERST
jgi:pilus assembly protein CpaE